MERVCEEGEGKGEIGHGERRREQLCVVYFVPNFGGNYSSHISLLLLLLLWHLKLFLYVLYVCTICLHDLDL